MELLNKVHNVDLVLENCECINVDVEFTKLDVTTVDMALDKNYTHKFIENAMFKIKRSELQKLCDEMFTVSEERLTYEQRLMNCLDIAQVWFNNQYVRQHIVGNKEDTLFMVWNNEEDYANESYTIQLDDDYLYITTDSLKFSNKEKKYIVNSTTKTIN